MENISNEKLNELKAAGKKLFIDMKANWCQPCKQLTNQLEPLIDQYSDKISFYAIDIEEEDDAVKTYGVRSIPNVIIFDGETIIDNSTGLRPNSYYENIIRKTIGE